MYKGDHNIVWDGLLVTGREGRQLSWREQDIKVLRHKEERPLLIDVHSLPFSNIYLLLINEIMLFDSSTINCKLVRQKTNSAFLVAGVIGKRAESALLASDKFQHRDFGNLSMPCRWHVWHSVAITTRRGDFLGIEREGGCVSQDRREINLEIYSSYSIKLVWSRFYIF